MSETGRKMDVEDVLSSIRRLVSEEARTAPDTETTDENTNKTDENLLQQGNAAERDKLVLTPSLRISESQSSAPEAADLEQRIADIESLVMSEAVDDAHSDVTQNVDVQDIEDIETETDADGAGFAEMVEEVTDQVTDEVSADATSEMMSALHLSMKDFARAEPPLTANISGAPTHDDAPDDTGELDTADDTSEPHVEDAVFTEIEAAADIAQDDVTFPSDSPFEADLDEVPPQPDFMQTAKNEVPVAEEPEAPKSRVRDTLIDREPPLTAAEPEPAATEDAVFQEPMDYTDEDSFVDEETLREMVSDMVRSELQGELGDRITRNVRKLVRREIHRAMASRDFE
jgi:hypothetical protein